MRSPRAVRGLFGRIGLAAVLCTAVVAAGVVAVNRYIDDQVSKITRVKVTTAGDPAGGANFLIIGSDSRAFVDNTAEVKAFGNEQDTGPPRSDTMMVLHADGDHSFAVSFPRDLWVDIPGKGKAKINAAFNEGPQKVVDTLKADFGVDVNHYLEVDFKTFEGIVNAIGSVAVYFPAPARDELTGLNAPYAGCYHLDGAAALAYVRSRHLQYYDAQTRKWRDAEGIPDIGRIGRQQSFIRDLGRLAVERSLDDPLIAPDIVNELVPNLKADPTFDRGAVNQLVRAFLGLAEGHGSSLQFETLPWTDGPAQGGQQVLYLKQPDADATLARLRTFGNGAPASSPGSSVPPAVSARDVRVRVLNASGVQGAAATAGAALAKLGFVDAGTGNDPRGLVEHSEVRYRSDRAAAELVAASVPGSEVVSDTTVSGADVVVVLGRNFTGIGAVNPVPPTSGGGGSTTTVPKAEADCR